MFKIKRPAIIGILLVLLVFTGYLNYRLTQDALTKVSKDYQNYEVMQMENNEYMSSEEDFDIVDSLPNEENITNAITTSNNELGELSKTVSDSNINYFVEYRLSRDKLRAGLVDRLDGIIKNTQTTDDVRTKAQEEIMKIGETSEKELQIEGLVKAKGFEDALAFITSDEIKVVVSTDELTQQDMVKILDIVKSETKFDTESIKIMKKQ
ncbi:SpoIIIAH-like family protein [Paratissierella segnis]|jgi:stage III sporulation protein AH|uniref:SpoIIIAH-like family protein n=1 Tax=Paratissierella segnis TaxID=2763679 RepID=A0A926EVT4_9FIRM|nr:SpoIIIAH-like family protein [Paratissierella segnis]MBC8588437.1 SpoIIIAH-like family protein [Paratissierella segnis]